MIAGPANAGKVEQLLGRYLDSLEREPVLIVPNRADVERVERDLLARRPALLGGTIGTFDDLFERLASGGEGARPLLSRAQRALLVLPLKLAAQVPLHHREPGGHSDHQDRDLHDHDLRGQPLPRHPLQCVSHLSL